jgi:hypothetical protein
MDYAVFLLFRELQAQHSQTLFRLLSSGSASSMFFPGSAGMEFLCTMKSLGFI